MPREDSNQNAILKVLVIPFNSVNLNIRTSSSRTYSKENLTQDTREYVDAAHGRSLTLHGLEVGRQPIAGNNHTAHDAHAKETAGPYNSLPQYRTREHGFVTHFSLPENKDYGIYTSATK